MRILHVIPGLTHERGGPTTVVCALGKHQVAAGHDVHVLSTDQGARNGEQLVELPAGVTSECAAVWGPDRLAFAPRFGSLVRNRLSNCDVVHVHSIFTQPVQVALQEALKARIPVILRPCGHLHQYSLQRTRSLKRVYLTIWGRTVRRACTCWHYTSEQEARESWPGPGAPHFVLPNGIEPTDYSLDCAAARDHIARTWPELGNQPYVLFLARFHPKKRLDLLLEAFLAGAPREYKLVVAGPDECNMWKPLAARFLADAASAARVVRLGTVTGRDKIALLAGASLFMLPSEHENFGNAALEALATGTQVLLSPQVDLTGDLQSEHGCHRAALEVAAWSERLASLLAQSQGWNADRERLRQEIGRRYSWERISAELIQRYRDVQANRLETVTGPAMAALSAIAKP